MIVVDTIADSSFPGGRLVVTQVAKQGESKDFNRSKQPLAQKESSMLKGPRPEWQLTQIELSLYWESQNISAIEAKHTETQMAHK